MRKFEMGDQVKYENVLGEIRDAVVIQENKTTVKLRDGFKIVSIMKKYILEG